ncbi:hypothetical protein LRS12_00675 [Sphingomonas sp. J344]|nr:hypothetical protein [Sphingomonas sp. J344]MCR5869401.1 hypothetical protein [Sphingomonas sp. J344]
MLFLGTEYDRAFLDDVVHYGHDLDSLLHGNLCIGVLFMPPPESPGGRLEDEFERFHSLRWSEDPTLTEKLVERMSKESYDVARFLGIPLQDLPGIAFLSASEPDNVAYVPLRKSSLKDIYPDLRRVMSDWYSDNRAVLEQFRTEWREARNEQVAHFAHQVGNEIQRSGKASHLVRKLPRAISRAGEDPADLRNLMVRQGLSVEIEGKVLDGTAVEQELVALRQRAQASPPPLPDFQLDRIRKVSRKIKFQHVALLGSQKSKGMLEWIRLIREALAPL